jgi:hypothetical protein
MSRRASKSYRFKGLNWHVLISVMKKYVLSIFCLLISSPFRSDDAALEDGYKKNRGNGSHKKAHSEC